MLAVDMPPEASDLVHKNAFTGNLNCKACREPIRRGSVFMCLSEMQVMRAPAVILVHILCAKCYAPLQKAVDGVTGRSAP